MIDPKLLTEENGFVEGEWIHCSTNLTGRMGFVGKLHSVIPECGVVRFYDEDDAKFSEIVSIRPLTGPMAIWNFAPVWAESCIIGMNGVYWIKGSRPEDSDWPDLGWEKIIFRPFWAKATQ